MVHMSVGSLTCHWLRPVSKSGGTLWSRQAAQIKGADFLMLTIIVRRISYSKLYQCVKTGDLNEAGNTIFLTLVQNVKFYSTVIMGGVLLYCINK